MNQSYCTQPKRKRKGNQVGMCICIIRSPQNQPTQGNFAKDRRPEPRAQTEPKNRQETVKKEKTNGRLATISAIEISITN
jgi:hypothetical protein